MEDSIDNLVIYKDSSSLAFSKATVFTATGGAGRPISFLEDEPEKLSDLFAVTTGKFGRSESRVHIFHLVSSYLLTTVW